MSKFHISTRILQGNALFFGKFYTAGIVFTRPQVATNFKSANCPRLTLSPFPSFPKNILFCFVLVFCFVLCPMLTLRSWSPVHLSKNKYFHQSWTILHQRDKSWWIGNKIFCFMKSEKRKSSNILFAKRAQIKIYHQVWDVELVRYVPSYWPVFSSFLHDPMEEGKTW